MPRMKNIKAWLCRHGLHRWHKTVGIDPAHKDFGATYCYFRFCSWCRVMHLIEIKHE